ncbi:MAG: nuclear transport factor 2 family protein [Chitinophagaceae bacterium]|nr:nuclear transport factor 2 family protein [Chitinophagaceae bacterium]
MKRPFIIYLTAMILASQAFAQTTEDSVKTTVNNLFAAMKNGDAAALKNAFADSAILQTISVDKDGNVRIRNENIKAFAEFVGKQPKGAADERISFETIRIDGPLAIVWTPYKFYLNNNFSHCGVNSFQLVRLKGEWKIQYLIDTRRRSPCD